MQPTQITHRIEDRIIRNWEPCIGAQPRSIKTGCSKIQNLRGLDQQEVQMCP